MKTIKKSILIICSAFALNTNAQVCFTSATSFSVGTWPYSVCSADFNGDGKTDLATSNYSTNNISVLLGTGTGSFGSATNFIAGTGPYSVTSADFNGDAKADLAVANRVDSSISVLLGTGTGSFGAATSYTLNYFSMPSSIISADFNGDGKADLVTANVGTHDISVLLGTGTGSFGTAANYSVCANPTSVNSADFNGDGKADLAVTNSSTGSGSAGGVLILLGTGTGNFSAPTVFTLGLGASSVISADFNRDAKVDLAVVDANGSDTVWVLLGTGTGNFSIAATHTVGTNPQSVISADFNGDGKLDLATANQVTNNISLLLGTGTGNFSTAVNFVVGTAPYSLINADFNADGRLDLATANHTSNNVSILLSTADSLSGIIHNSIGIPINSGTVHLFRQEPNHVGLYDTAGVVTLNANGTYSFPTLFCNNYLLKVVADTIAFPNSIGTYYNSGKLYPYQWDSALVINHNTCGGSFNNSGKNVTVLDMVPASGPGVISGQVTQGYGYGQRNSTPNQVMGAPLKGVDIKLGKNPGGCAAARTTSDGSGHYTFSNVALGDYFIYVDEPNLPMNSVIGVALTSTATTSANNDYYVDSIKVWVGQSTANISTIFSLDNNVAIYPNPTSDQFFIDASTSDKLTVDLFDLNGRHVFSKSVSAKSNINVTDLNNGVYNLTIKTVDRVINKKLVIVH